MSARNKTWMIIVILAGVLAGCSAGETAVSVTTTPIPAGEPESAEPESSDLESTELESTDRISTDPTPYIPDKNQDRPLFQIPDYDPGFGFDSIPPIYDPEFVGVRDAPLHDDELVIGTSINGETKAYPINVLRFREMVNDDLGGIPILVTW